MNDEIISETESQVAHSDSATKSESNEEQRIPSIVQEIREKKGQMSVRDIRESIRLLNEEQSRNSQREANSSSSGASQLSEARSELQDQLNIKALESAQRVADTSPETQDSQQQLEFTNEQNKQLEPWSQTYQQMRSHREESLYSSNMLLILEGSTENDRRNYIPEIKRAIRESNFDIRSLEGLTPDQARQALPLEVWSLLINSDYFFASQGEDRRIAERSFRAENSDQAAQYDNQRAREIYQRPSDDPDFRYSAFDRSHSLYKPSEIDAPWKASLFAEKYPVKAAAYRVLDERFDTLLRISEEMDRDKEVERERVKVYETPEEDPAFVEAFDGGITPDQAKRFYQKYPEKANAYAQALQIEGHDELAGILDEIDIEAHLDLARRWSIAGRSFEDSYLFMIGENHNIHSIPVVRSPNTKIPSIFQRGVREYIKYARIRGWNITDNMLSIANVSDTVSYSNEQTESIVQESTSAPSNPAETTQFSESGNQITDAQIEEEFPFLPGIRPPRVEAKEIRGKKIAVSDVYQEVFVPVNESTQVLERAVSGCLILQVLSDEGTHYFHIPAAGKTGLYDQEDQLNLNELVFKQALEACRDLPNPQFTYFLNGFHTNSRDRRLTNAKNLHNHIFPDKQASYKTILSRQGETPDLFTSIDITFSGEDPSLPDGYYLENVA